MTRRFSWWWGLGLVALAAFALRLAYLGQVSAMPIFADPVGDSAAHLARAAEIARGQWLPSRPFYYCSIFYPYFLALALGAPNGSLLTVALFQIVAGTAVVAMLAILGRRLFGDTVGLLVGAIAALYGPSAFFEADVLGVVWGQLALVTGMMLVLRWLDTRRAALLAGAGLAFGFAAVERPNLLLVAAATLAWIAWVDRARWRKAFVSFVPGLIAPLLVVLALNVLGTGQWVPLTTSGGINLALGYHDGATGTYDEPWEAEAPEFSAQHVEPEEAMTLWASKKAGRALTPQEASRYWLGQAMRWIGAHPAEAAVITGRKALLLINATEVPNHLDFAFIRQRAWMLKWMFLGFAPVLGLAGIGAALLWRGPRHRAAVYCLLTSAAAMLSIVPFTVADRYRAPMLPGLFLLAGFGAYALVGLVRDTTRRREARALVAVGLGMALLAVSSIQLVRPLQGRNYWMFAQAFEKRGDLERAIANYEAAVKEDPNDAQLLNNLGNAYRRAELTGLAGRTLARAAKAEPRLAYPHKSLAVYLIDEGKLDAALVELEAAHAILPTDVEVLGLIGAIHAERGERAAADAAFAEARALAPDDRRLAALIARYRG